MVRRLSRFHDGSAYSSFEPYPAGDFSWHHLWFIIYLYVYVLLLMPLAAVVAARASP